MPPHVEGTKCCHSPQTHQRVLPHLHLKGRRAFVLGHVSVYTYCRHTMVLHEIVGQDLTRSSNDDDPEDCSDMNVVFAYSNSRQPLLGTNGMSTIIMTCLSVCPRKLTNAHRQFIQFIRIHPSMIHHQFSHQ